MCVLVVRFALGALVRATFYFLNYNILFFFTLLYCTYYIIFNRHHLHYSTDFEDTVESSVPFRPSYLLITSYNLKQTRDKFYLSAVCWFSRSSQRRRRALTFRKHHGSRGRQDAATPPSQVCAHTPRKHFDQWWKESLLVSLSQRSTG